MAMAGEAKARLSRAQAHAARMERRDVDLILGQGMLAAGWLAHKLNAPGKFLISAPEYDTPRRAHAYLVTDQVPRD